MKKAETDGGHLPWKKPPTAVRSCTFDPRTEPQRCLTSFFSNVWQLFFIPSLQSCTLPSVPRCLARRFQRNFQSVRRSSLKTRAKHLVCKFHLQSITKNLRKCPKLPDLNCIIATLLETNRTNSRHLLKSPAVRVEFQLFFYLPHSQFWSNDLRVSQQDNLLKHQLCSSRKKKAVKVVSEVILPPFFNVLKSLSPVKQRRKTEKSRPPMLRTRYYAPVKNKMSLLW